MAIGFGYRGAIFSSGLLIAAVATAVIFLVPADTVRRKERDQSGAAIELPPFKPTLQFALAILLYFALFALGAFRSIATPIALKDIAGAHVTEATGLAFTLGGIAPARWAYGSCRRASSANSACATFSPSPACSPRSRICCSR